MCLLILVFLFSALSWAFASAHFIPGKLRRGNRAFLVERCNFVGVKTVSAQDGAGVLAVEWRARSHLAGRLRELDRQSDRLHLAERGMLDLDHHFARDGLR